MAATEVVALVLAYYRAPLAYQERFAPSAPTPVDIGQLLALAHGSDQALGDAARHCGAPPDELRAATRFLIQQLCFARGASHYRVLGVEPGASLEQIKEHHRRLMWLFHPDRTAGCDTWTAGYATRINDAWNTLSRPELRANYDIRLLRPEPKIGTDAANTRPPSPTPAPSRRGRQAPPRRRAARRPWRALLALGGCTLIGVLLTWTINFMVPTSVPPIYAPASADLSPPTPVADHMGKQAELEWVRGQQQRSERHKVEQALSPGASAPAAAAVAVAVAVARPPAQPLPTRTQQPRVEPAPAQAGTAPTASFSPVAVAAPPPIDHTRDNSALTVWEAENLVNYYTSAYQRGDLNGVMALFAPGARGKDGADRIGIRRAYAAMFKSFLIRRLRLLDVRWDLRGDTADAVARYELWLQGRDSGQPSQLAGNIYLTLHKRGGQVLIEAIDYTWRAH